MGWLSRSWLIPATLLVGIMIVHTCKRRGMMFGCKMSTGIFFSGIHGMLWIYESKWWAILTSWFAVSRLASLVLGKTKATWRIWAPFVCELHFAQWIWITGLPARSSKFAINHFAHVSYDQTYYRPVTKVAQSKSSLIAKLYYSLLMLMLAMILILEFAALLSYSSCCNSYKARAAATSCI